MRQVAALLMLAACAWAHAVDLGPELLPRGDMEQGAGLTSSNSGSAALPRVNEQTRADKHAGAASRHVIIARETTNEWPGAITDFYATETGKTYQVRFWTKVLKGSFSVLVRNGAGNDNLMPKPSATCAPQLDMTNQFPVWSEYVGTYTESAGGSQAYLRFIIASAGETEFFLDDISVREVDTSPAAALRRWKAVCPNRALVCWQKSPWQNLEQVQFPPDELRECKGLALAMGQKEYESASFVLTNLTDAELPVTVSLRPAKLPVTLRQAMWVTEHDGGRGNDALPLLEGPLTIPSGESREVWLTVQSRGEKAGDYATTVDVKAPGVPAATVPLKVKVYPVTLPDEKPLYTAYWDYLVPQWCGPELARAYAADLKAHYANVGVMHPWSVRMEFDAAGKPSFSDLDVALATYRELAPRILLVNLLCEVYAEKQDGFMTEAWQGRFKGWLRDLVKHLATQGFGYDRIVIYPYDETIGPNVAAVCRLIKEADPKLRVYINAIGQTEEQVRNIAPFMDVWSPYLYDYMGLPPYDRPAALRNLASKLLHKDDRFFWTYTNPLSNQPKLAPPYGDYRLAPWRAWTLGMNGCGYWIYSYKTHWDSYKHEDGPNWAVVYLANAKDAPPGLSQKELVIPSKRWEATREGVEDVCYLHMLRQAVAVKRKPTPALTAARKLLADLPAAVLADSGNMRGADDAKTKIMAALASLR